MCEESSEKLTNQLIEELSDPTIFIRSCILRGSKHISKCINNIDTATKYINDQLEHQIIELGQLNTIQNLCNDFVKLEKCSKIIGTCFSNYKNSVDIDAIPIIEKYDNIKDHLLVSRRILQVQSLCNRAIEFISLISRLKVQFGLKKGSNSDEHNNSMIFQTVFHDSVDIAKTSKIIVELESMIYFNEESFIESEIFEEGINNSRVSSLEFVEVLQEDIKWLRRLSATYRQNGHKKLLKGVEEMDKDSIYSGCIILDQFGELWEHIDILVEDVALKRVNHAFQVSNLQKCIRNTDQANEVFVVTIEYATISIMAIIENALNQIIIGLKQLICIYDTLLENKISCQRNNQMNFVNTFWEKCSLNLEIVFNNIYSVNTKNSKTHQISLGKEIIVNNSLKLEQIFHLLINCYPDISTIFNNAMKNIKALLSSSSKTIASTITHEKSILNSISKIREIYLLSVKDRFSKLFETLIPNGNHPLYSYEKLNNKISDIIHEITKEMIRTASCSDISTRIYDIFKNELLCFMVTCETVIQPEGGIITYFERTGNYTKSNFLIENNVELKKRLPLPAHSHHLNACISIIAAILSDKVKIMCEIDQINNIDTSERDRITELLRSLQYKSTGKWFSQTSSAILELHTLRDAKIKADHTPEHKNLVTSSQEIVNNFVQNWIPLLSQHQFWSKCYALFCRNLIIIFLVDFTLRKEFDEASCFEIAEEIVSLQSIISHFTSDQTTKCLLLNDIKMIQDFRRVLFSDIKSIEEAINSQNNLVIKESSNNDILWDSINNLDNILFPIHILNRIYCLIASGSCTLPIKSFTEHFGVNNSHISINIANSLFSQLNKYPACESDTDLFVIFNIFRQNSNNEFANNPKLLSSMIIDYLNIIEGEIQNENPHIENYDYTGQFNVLLNYIRKNC
ncbi:hypothetical protein OJ253_883 [Cryptosporidium canis]|uniref:Uncharacterized protein n=1 Tax=Cryptosporidium canis TaxID=195482 RepID=A0A9D5DHX4_9CRYT|nr:hypothetical protein OJ253_883 [Cryptosporidium canis]